jgi:tetratricopeptide (TPR) repeat protein
MPRSKGRRKKSTTAKGGSKPLPELSPGLMNMEALMSLFGAQPDGDPALDEAQDLIYQAWEAATPEQAVALAKQALEISPLCADAFGLLARHAEPGSAAELEFYRRGVAAGEAALGEATFAEDVGHFWGLLETRPCMRARFGLAEALWRRGERDAALDHFRDMLRLNPGDNQGVRYVLAAYLVEAGRDDELGTLLAQYDGDGSAAWFYSKALAAYRRAGDTEEGRRLLAGALKFNAHVPAYLLGERRMPKTKPPFISPGDEDEAICYADEFAAGWTGTEGALAWLRDRRGATRARAPRR